MVHRNNDFDRLVSTSWFRQAQPPQQPQPQPPSPPSITLTPSHRLGIIIIIIIISAITLKKNKLFQVSVIEPVEITLTLLDDHYRHVSLTKSNNALK